MDGYIALTLMARTQWDVSISIQMENDVTSLVLFEETGYRADVVDDEQGRLTVYRDVRLTDEEVVNSMNNLMYAMESGMLE